MPKSRDELIDALARVYMEAALDELMADQCVWTWHPEDGGYFEYKLGTACVTLQRRPVYCDRGHWCGKVFGVDGIDDADAFPRYYMDETRAKDEMREWLHWRLKK